MLVADIHSWFLQQSHGATEDFKWVLVLDTEREPWERSKIKKNEDEGKIYIYIHED